MEILELEVNVLGQEAILAAFTVQLVLYEIVKQKQMEDSCFKRVVEGLGTEKRRDFTLDNGVLKFKGRVCVPDESEVKKQILEEAHKSQGCVLVARYEEGCN